MKKIIFEKPYQPFLFIAFIAFCISIFFEGAHPESVFDVSIYNYDFTIPFSKVWFAFFGYLVLLTGIYYLTFRARLQTKKWLVTSHYVFIILFLVFFVFFSGFANKDIQRLIAGLPFSTLISIYGIIFFTDLLFFILGVVLLFVNLFTLKRNTNT